MPILVKALRKRLRWLLATPAQRRHSLVGPVHDWEQKREFQIRFLKSVGLLPHHYLLDVGCGTLRGGIPIIHYLELGHYFGLECRMEVLTEARRELKDHGLEAKQPSLFHSSSLADVALGQRFDFVWAFSVLIHMSDEILEGCLLLVARHLKDSGVFYANVNIGERPDGQWQGFPLVYRSASFYEAAARQQGLKVEEVDARQSFDDLGIRHRAEQRVVKLTHLP